MDSGGFEFGSGDNNILRSYDHHDSSNGSHSDLSSKDFEKNRVSRSSMFSTANGYTEPDNQELVSTVERTMKKYSDNLMRFLEGISSRLSQLELYCYNLDKSIGEMRSELARDNGEADSMLKFLEKHLQEVHRSVQILRDKQELAETQKELAKLQLAQKESSPPTPDERTTASPSSPKKNDDVSDSPNTQLALALPSQIAQQPTHPAVQQHPVVPPQPSSQAHSQHQTYYLSSNQIPSLQAQPPPSYLAPDPQYRISHIAPQAPPQPSQNQVNSSQSFPQYPPPWPQQVTQPMQPPMQPGNPIRAPSPQPNIYPYMTSQPNNAPLPEGIPSTMSMQRPFPGIPQVGESRLEGMPYGYGGAIRPVQPQPSPPQMKAGLPSAPGGGYVSVGPHPPISSVGTYMLYDSDGIRSNHPPQQIHYSQSGYISSNPSSRPLPGPGHQQYVQNHPYTELIDKLVSMGYRIDHVASVIQRLEETGQAVDFNAVLDRLNGHSSGSSQPRW